MNKLQCPLCHLTFNDPCMCPHCSQVYCQKCIMKYLQDFYFCPSCDRHIIDLIDCSRLINEVKEKIKESDLKKLKDHTSAMLQQCSEHSLPMKYHCLTCQSDICSDCGLISQKHKGHNIQPIKNIQPAKNTISESQLKQIKSKIEEKLQSFQEQQKRCILELQLLKSQIKYNKAKIYEYYQELILRLENETQSLLKEIEDRINQCAKQINENLNIKGKIDQIEKNHVNNLMKESYSPLINSFNRQQQTTTSIQITDKQLYKYLTDKNYIKPKNCSSQKLIQKPNISFRRNKLLSKKQISQQRISQQQSCLQSELNQQPFMQNSLLFDKKIYQLGIMQVFVIKCRKQIYPEYHNFSFQMDYLLLKDEDVVYSPQFRVYGYEWCLKIYPKGNAQSHHSHLSVFLQLTNSPQSSLTLSSAKQYLFRLQLLNLNQAGKSVIKQYNSRFSVGECWGYSDFVSLREIKDYLHDGKLLFVMGVKNASYFDLCDNMTKYITKLESQNRALKEICENCYVADRNGNYLNGSIAEELGIDSESLLDRELLDESSVINGINMNSIMNGLALDSHRLAYEDEISSIISSVDDD